MVTRLEDLPAFEVQRIIPSAEPELIGVFNHLRGVRAGRSWLYAGNADSLVGDLSDINQAKSTARFVAPFWSPASVIQVGGIVPWLDGYWNASHVTMILDSTANWQRTQFLPSPAQHFQQKGASGWMKVGQELPEGAVATRIEKDGWDHEHCETCHERIGVGGATHGYVNQTDHWLCERCHHDYAAQRSLGFLLRT